MLANTFPDDEAGSIKVGESLEALIWQHPVSREQKALEIISQLHDDFAAYKTHSQINEALLQTLTAFTGSEYGFIGEPENNNSTSGLCIKAVCNMRRHPDVRPYFGTRTDDGQYLIQLHTLSTQVLLTGRPVLNNNPAADERPAGKPACPTPIFRNFLGLPLIRKGEVTGMIGFADREGGYDPGIIALLRPILFTYTTLLYTDQADTLRAGMEAANRQLSADIDALMNTLDDIVFEMDEHKVFTKVWCKQENLLFIPMKEVIGKSISEVMGEHSTAFCKMADTLLLTGEPQYYEYTDIRQNLHHWYALKMSQIMTSQPGPKRLLLLIQNITQRKRDELELRHVNAALARNIHLLDITQQMGLIGGWEFNIVTGEIYWTRQVYQMREVPENFRPSFDDGAFYHPDDRPLLQAAHQQLLVQQKRFCLELRHISARNTCKWVKTVGMPVYTNDTLTHFRGIIMDIDKQKLSELELGQARVNAEQAAKGRSDFLSVMSHEIRTPLNAIIGIAGIMQDDPAADHKEVLHSLQFSANHLLGLVNDILDFSKIEAGKIELEHVPLNLRELVQDIAANFQPLAKAKGIKLYTNIDHDLAVQITGDPVRLSQILSNLVNNAIKFTDKGAVTLEIHQESYIRGKCSISFKVKDTGVGIAPEMLEQVFDTFVQEDSATTRQYGGTGLGLAITRRLVELMQGNIHISSVKGAGTTFYFTLDFELPESAAADRQTDLSLPPGFLTGMHLLIVEDNKINVRVMQLQLAKSGATTTVAVNGKDAILKMEQQKFDGVMLDLHMPEMNGYETIPHIRTLQPNAFIVVLTADIMPEVSERLHALHVKDILPKPYKATDLYRVLVKYRLSVTDMF
ncbi:ATP-binding protein [Chitinophaga solisilvae]|uniref:ATP-binding protein n=1 Tax=Chitinophaga solisilvae TaxID=1233460 RepID=UPI00136DCF20|nr:ATP-binding protein [Chitinophaga solisilvae]